MVAPYFEDEKGRVADLKDKQMIRVYFHMLEAIAGIPVMDHFEVNLFPMKIQLEREVGKKLFEYIFPEMEDAQAVNSSNPPGTPSIMRTNDSGDADSLVDDYTSGSGRYGSGGSDKESPFDTRAGSLELRLRPTLTLDSRIPQEDANPKPKAVSVHSGEGTHILRLLGAKTASKKPSYESLRPSNIPKPGIGRSSTTVSSNSESKKGTRFALPRKPGISEVEPSDDLSKMITRASSYMTFAYIKMPSVVLCLSYKGKGERNIADVHDFVFRLPAIEYRNKTWSNLDLAMNLKNHVIRALISHTGAIISNKFSKHRPNTAQQNKLREVATSSVLLAATPILSSAGDNSDDSSSLLATSPVDYSRSPPRSLRDSQSSSSAFPRPSSRSSSIASSHSYNQSGSINSRNGDNASSYLKMAPGTRAITGLGIDIGRPKSSSSSRHLEPVRPSTSGSNMGDGQQRRKPGGTGFLRDKISALTNRLKDRDGSDAKGDGPEYE
jgi:hypothetical protein